MSRNGRRELVALVADDTPPMREMLAALLERNGIDRVLQAADGVQALRSLREADPPVDIVFCDMDMPVMDGVDTLRRIALAHPEVSVVMFSGVDPRVLSAVRQMSQIQGLQVLGVLGKPFSEPDVGKLLERWRRARRAPPRAPRAELTAEEIDAALAEDRIEVHYQPKIRMSDGEPVAVEALIRLNDPHLGVMAPSAFLPVAEAQGRMPALTRRVLEKSLEQASRWSADGLSLALSINLAPDMLRRLDIPDMIAGLAQQHRFEHERLTLEVTEEHVDLSPEMLHNAARLRLKGFALSIDDFGTGDSGIGRLRSLPFTELKLDRSFVEECEQREDLRLMLQASIELAHRLRMAVVAEGVETWEQWRLLRALHCDTAQGYLSGAALPAGQVPQALQLWRARLRSEATGPRRLAGAMH